MEDYTAEPGSVVVHSDRSKEGMHREEQDPLKKKKRFKYF
jgi:hypothetical protein